MTIVEIFDLNITDASNTGRWPEGMAPSAVNNAGRADEGLLARWFADTNGSTSDGGTANARTFAANQTFTAYFAGMRLAIKSSIANTGALTIDVDSLGAKSIVLNDGAAGAITSGQIPSGAIYEIAYDGTNFVLLYRPLA